MHVHTHAHTTHTPHTDDVKCEICRDVACHFNMWAHILLTLHLTANVTTGLCVDCRRDINALPMVYNA